MSASKPKSSGEPGNRARDEVSHDKLGKLKKGDYIVGDSEDIVHMDWSSEWIELKNLDSELDGGNHG